MSIRKASHWIGFAVVEVTLIKLFIMIFSKLFFSKVSNEMMLRKKKIEIINDNADYRFQKKEENSKDKIITNF
jgi:hypothetical protein